MSERATFRLVLAIRYGTLGAAGMFLATASLPTAIYVTVGLLIIVHGVAGYFHGALAEKSIQREAPPA